MVHVPYTPTIRLACVKCQRQTDHVLTDFSNDPASALTLLYECQECRNVKKVYELNTLPEFKAVGLSANLRESPEAMAVRAATSQAIPIEKEPQINR